MREIPQNNVIPIETRRKDRENKLIEKEKENIHFRFAKFLDYLEEHAGETTAIAAGPDKSKASVISKLSEYYDKEMDITKINEEVKAMIEQAKQSDEYDVMRMLFHLNTALYVFRESIEQNYYKALGENSQYSVLMSIHQSINALVSARKYFLKTEK